MGMCARVRLAALAVCAAGLSAGCYLFHTPAETEAADGGVHRDARGVPRPEAGAPDAGPRTDAWTAPLIDAGPLPDDEPDVAPGERPSDGESAGEWTDPPPHPEGDPCCELVGEPVPLDGPMLQGGPPDVVWNGRGWGVAFRAFETREVWFRELDVDARPLAPPRTHPGADGAWVSLAWGNHRYGLWSTSRFGILDRHGGLRAEFTALPGLGKGRAARFAAVHGWAVAATDDRAGDGSAAVHAVRIGDDAIPLGPPAEVAFAAGFSDGVPAVVGLLSRAVVVWAGAGGVQHRTLFPDGSLGEPGHLMTMHPYRTEWGSYADGHAIVAAGFRDAVVAAGADGSHVHVVVYDPFEDAVLGGPFAVADSPTVDARMGLAGDAKTGLIGLCYPYGEGPFGGSVDGRGPPDADQIRFRLLGPTGEPRGAPVVVAGGLPYAAGCAVGATSSGFVVVWWNAAGLAPTHDIMAQRVRPR